MSATWPTACVTTPSSAEGGLAPTSWTAGASTTRSTPPRSTSSAGTDRPRCAPVASCSRIAVGIGIALGLLTRVAALGGMVLALSLWLTVSWGAEPWYTSADLVYLFAFTPLLLAGAGGVWSLDAWLEAVRARRPGAGEDRFRRAVLVAGAVLIGGVLAAGATLFRRSSPPGPRHRQHIRRQQRHGAAPWRRRLEVPVGGGKEVTDPISGDPTWVSAAVGGAVHRLRRGVPASGMSRDVRLSVGRLPLPVPRLDLRVRRRADRRTGSDRAAFRTRFGSTERRSGSG